MRFGTTYDNEIIFLCHLDSCAGMNTANLLLHQWMITNHPEIVVSYEEYTDSNLFMPLKLNCAIPKNEDTNNCDGQLTAVATYRTRYMLPNGNHVTIIFGLGKDIQFNVIFPYGFPFTLMMPHQVCHLMLNLSVVILSAQYNTILPVSFSI